MSEDLEAIQASLKRLLASKNADSEAHAKALTVAMHGIQAALAELIEAGERSDEAAQKHADEAEKHWDAMGDAASQIAQAIGKVRVEVPAQPAPVVNVAAPTVNVQAPSVTVSYLMGTTPPTQCSDIPFQDCFVPKSDYLIYARCR